MPREALASASPDEARLHVFEQLWVAPFSITEPDSGFLLVLGMFMALIALLDGFKFDDPYPHIA